MYYSISTCPRRIAGTPAAMTSLRFPTRHNVRLILPPVVLNFVLASSLFALKPEREYRAKPSDYGIIYQEIVFRTADSLAIKGWFYPAQDTTGIVNALVGHIPVPPQLKRSVRPYATLDTFRRPTIVVCPGDAGNMSYLILYAYHLCTQGFNVLTFDWRGFGESSNWTIDQDQLCYTEFLKDYDAALDWVKRRPEVDSTRIGVFGYSTGAYLSFAMTARRRDIAAYAGRGLMSAFKDAIPLLRAIDSTRQFKVPNDYPAELEPINAARSIKVPVFIIAGEMDGRTPPWMARQVGDEINSSKELWIVPHARHGGSEGPEFLNYPEFFHRLGSFFKKHLMM